MSVIYLIGSIMLTVYVLAAWAAYKTVTSKSTAARVVRGVVMKQAGGVALRGLAGLLWR
jgi:hypothetical protein